MNKVSKKIIILLIFSILSCKQAVSVDIPKMANLCVLLEAYGFNDCIFNPTQNTGTSEAYLTHRFFNPAYPDDNNKIKIIREEFPNNRIGALRVFSIWEFRIAYKPESYEHCLKNIKGIKDWLKEGIDIELISPVKGEYKIPPMTFTDEEIVDYYSKAIRNKIEGIALKGISSDEVKQLRELLITYCVAPTKENGEAFTKYAKEVGNAKPDKAKAIDAFMEELSPELKKTLGL